MIFHIVDDEEVIQEVLAEMLSLVGIETKTFSSPTEYLSEMKKELYCPPSAIFSDIQMPDMNGYDFMGIIHNSIPTQRFVILSGFSDLEHQEKNMACKYLCKPFDFKAIEDVIETITKCECKGCFIHDTEDIRDNRLDFGVRNWSCPIRKMQQKALAV